MSGELYQLVAINEQGVEQVIELKNDNKNNKGFLSFIDSGTTLMENERMLIDYLIKQGKIDNPNVTFAIKYNNRGIKYLPVVYNNPELRFLSLNAKDEKILKAYARYLIEKIDNEICNSDFYQNILALNDEIFQQISNGNYLDKHFLEKLRRFYEPFGLLKEGVSEKEHYKKELCDSLKTYKTIRTLYLFYKIHLSCKLNNQSIEDNHEYDIPEVLKYLIPEESKESVNDIPQELQKAYDQGGMDAVWAIADSEEIIGKGYKFK